MKPCPFCRETIQDDAIKCRHCSSLLVPMPASGNNPAGPELDSRQVMLVLDRGFLYFAKYVSGVAVLLIAAGGYYFGFDLKRSYDDIKKSHDDILKTFADVKNMSTEIEKTVKTAQKTAENAQQTADEIKKTLQHAKDDVTLFNSTVQQALAIIPSKAGSTQEPAVREAYTITQLASLYGFPKSLNGAGKTIGVIELGGGYRQSDLHSFFSSLHTPIPTITAVSVGGAKNQPNSDAAINQVEGDIEVIGAIAPKAHIKVYFAPNTSRGFLDAILAAARDHVSVLSIGWGAPESNWTSELMDKMNGALKAAANAGITVVASAGDNGVGGGANDGRPDVYFPSSSPWVLAVGGTRLMAKQDTIDSEVAWNDGKGGATGGGVSAIIPLPEWQRDARVPARREGGSGRGIPDVAASAAPETGYRLFVNGNNVVLGGTAMAAPLWAGLITLLDQGLPHDLGYFNPRLYREIGPANVLRSITSGNNSVAGVPGFSAGPGWNAVAGWGTPNGTKLLEWLRAHPK